MGRHVTLLGEHVGADRAGKGPDPVVDSRHVALQVTLGAVLFVTMRADVWDGETVCL